MKNLHRRTFLTGAGVAAVGASLAASTSRAAGAKSEKIKIGQIGTGHAHAAGVFTQLLEVTDEYEVVGLVENDPERRAKLTGRYLDVPLLTEEELLNTSGLQAVVVETEVHDLLPTARRCVAAGMNIHLDKPAGENLVDYKELLDEVARRKLHLQMGYIYRYHPAFQFCYRAVAEGWLGDLFEVHAVMSKKIGSAQRENLAQFSGGSMFEIGCHVIDAMVRVMGKPQQVTAFARQTHPDQDALVDNQLAVFDYPNAIASVRSALVEYEGFLRRQFYSVWRVWHLRSPAASRKQLSAGTGKAAGRIQDRLPGCDLARRARHFLSVLFATWQRYCVGKKRPIIPCRTNWQYMR